MSRYNILYIEDTIGLGGSLISLCHLLEQVNKEKYNAYAILYHKNQELYLKDRCKDVETVVALPRRSLKSPVVETFLNKFEIVFGKQGRRSGYFLIFLLDFLLSILPYSVRLYLGVRKWNIHLVHLNTGVCIPGIVLAKLLGVPCIATQRGPEWKSPVTELFSRHITFFMANSGATKEGLVDLGVHPSKISIVYPPVDLERFNFNIDSRERKKEFDMFSDEMSSGILGNIGEGKGHKIVLQAAAEVLKVIPNYKLFIIGDSPDGSDEYKEKLICYANELGIRSHVIFTGFRKDVPELIQLLDVVVHASLFPEPFGKVIIEGMAMKKPVIATCGGGTTEIIDDGINGFLVPPNDHKILAKRMIHLLRDRGLREKIGEAALKKVKTCYSIEKHIREVESIYEYVLGA